jgi:pimeloyl-ACP methyl ester carboxylesterase
VTQAQKLQTRCGTLEYFVSGQGRPAIVLFNGAGMTLAGWRELYPRIDSLGTVIAWNRFGVEGSAPPQRTQSGAVVAASVHEMLHYTGIEPPYVLVGHSLGARYAELFARLHPDEIAGALLLAPADLDQVQELDEEIIERALGKMLQRPVDAFRENLHAEVDAAACLADEIANAGPFPEVPVSVLTDTGSHFPQLAEPGLVLEELARVVKRSRRAVSGFLSLQP